MPTHLFIFVLSPDAPPRFPPEREGRRGHEIRELHHIRGRRNSSSPAKPRRGDSSGMDRPVKGYRSSESESSAETSALFTYSEFRNTRAIWGIQSQFRNPARYGGVPPPRKRAVRASCCPKRALGADLSVVGLSFRLGAPVLPYALREPRTWMPDPRRIRVW